MNNVRLEKQIKIWAKQLESAKNPIDRATLTDKINNAKKEMAKIEIPKSQKKIRQQIDAPALADKNVVTINNLPSNESYRGKVTDYGSVSTIEI